MEAPTRDAIVTALSAYDRLVEVGIGHRTEVACALVAAGKSVTATDVHPRSVPDGVRFVRDDITDPTDELYADADAIYALNLPPELHRPTRTVARDHGADFVFTTLGGERPTVPVTLETLPGEVLFVTDDGP